MPVAALYDIHGNLPALEAVLAEVQTIGIEQLVIGGDVLPGPMPRETIDCLLSIDLPVHFIRGNGDREILAQRAGTESPAIPDSFRDSMRWVAQQLTPADEQLLAGWPEVLRLHIQELGEVLFCHATPRSDSENFTRLTPEAALLPLFQPLHVQVAVCGHTHMQFDRMVGSTRVLNAGSVGMPFGQPGAHWLSLGPGVQLRHTLYDLNKAAERVRNTTYPMAQEFATANILQPPSEEQMLESMTRV